MPFVDTSETVLDMLLLVFCKMLCDYLVSVQLSLLVLFEVTL